MIWIYIIGNFSLKQKLPFLNWTLRCVTIYCWCQTLVVETTGSGNAFASLNSFSVHGDCNSVAIIKFIFQWVPCFPYFLFLLISNHFTPVPSFGIKGLPSDIFYCPFFPYFVCLFFAPFMLLIFFHHMYFSSKPSSILPFIFPWAIFFLQIFYPFLFVYTYLLIHL